MRGVLALSVYGATLFGSFAASIRMRCARLFFSMSLSLWGSPIPFLLIRDGASLKSETLPVLSRHRTGARVALQHCPVLPHDGSDCLHTAVKVNQTEFPTSTRRIFKIFAYVTWFRRGKLS